MIPVKDSIFLDGETNIAYHKRPHQHPSDFYPLLTKRFDRLTRDASHFERAYTAQIIHEQNNLVLSVMEEWKERALRVGRGCYVVQEGRQKFIQRGG